MKPGLSKSKIMSGLQCPRLLWLSVHSPELADWSGAEAVLAQGNAVGEVATSLFPDGILVVHDEALDKALTQSQELLDKGECPIFEATVQHDGVLIRADVMLPTNEGWQLIEVKSATSVKDHYLDDCAVQAWVLQQAGVPISTIELAHINRDFVYMGDHDFRGLLSFTDLSHEIGAKIEAVPEWIRSCRHTLAGDEPNIEPGAQCDQPNECVFKARCWPAPLEYPVSILPYGNKITAELNAAGYQDLREVPAERLSNEKHVRVHRATLNEKAELDEEAKIELAGHDYPRYYLDFETVQFAVPIWANTKPYQQIPFQWSCHIETEPDVLTHAEFLDTSGNAPMRALAESLIQTLGNEGPVYSYSAFEKTVLRGLAEAYPDLADDLNAIRDRLYDLLPLTRAHYYHPAMKGSWSIKAVLPTVAPDLSYKDLGEVQNGMAAGATYRELLNQDIDVETKNNLTNDLLAYCKLDTEAMVRLAWFLEKRKCV